MVEGSTTGAEAAAEAAVEEGLGEGVDRELQMRTGRRKVGFWGSEENDRSNREKGFEGFKEEGKEEDLEMEAHGEVAAIDAMVQEARRKQQQHRNGIETSGS